MIYADKNLARKLERAEARANASCVEARARLFPESGAEWTEVGGAYAMFDGSAESPLTQTFGLGVFDEITEAEIERIEAFFRQRGAPVFHEICPLAGVPLLTLLSERGYRPIELSNVLYRPVEQEKSFDPLAANQQIKTRVVEAGETELWARTAADGWASEGQELAEFVFQIGRVNATADGGFPFLAEIEGRPISAGMLFIHEDVALLAGASTVPEARRQGAQNALLEARLRFAARERGCTTAMMVALPGSQSQRNAEKNGFRVAYTRTKWQLDS